MALSNQSTLDGPAPGDILNLEAFRRGMIGGGHTDRLEGRWPGRQARRAPDRRGPAGPPGPPTLPWDQVPGWLSQRLAALPRKRRGFWKKVLSIFRPGAR